MLGRMGGGVKLSKQLIGARAKHFVAAMAKEFDIQNTLVQFVPFTLLFKSLMT